MATLAATRALDMIHTVDPRKEIEDEIKDRITAIEPIGAQVFVAIYRRPEKTVGGIILSEQYRGEDDYQGKVGLIMKMGPLAFQEDETHVWGPNKPKIGDWVMFRVGDTFPFLVKERTCRFVEDVNVKAILQSPDVIY